MKKICFIGVGNMGGAILRAVCTRYNPEDILIYCPTADKRNKIAAELGCFPCSSAAEAAADADYVVLGVKPGIIRNVLNEIAPAIKPDAVIVSMAAGITIGMIQETLGKALPCIRIIPNTPCVIGEGLLLMSPSKEVQNDQLEELKEILSPCGYVGTTDETHADICMTIGGCTPAYVYMFIESLADGAVACGLNRQDALTYAAKAVKGAAAMVLESGQHPGQLKDAVCSPGGSTIQGLKVLEDNHFRGSVINSITEAFSKNSSLGK